MPVDDEFRAGMARARQRFAELSEIMPMEVSVSEAADALEAYLTGDDRDCAYDALNILRMLKSRSGASNEFNK